VPPARALRASAAASTAAAATMAPDAQALIDELNAKYSEARGRAAPEDGVTRCADVAPRRARCAAAEAAPLTSRASQVHRSFEDNFWSTKMALPGASIDGALAQP
jgi:hypothetical protein